MVKAFGNRFQLYFCLSCIAKPLYTIIAAIIAALMVDCHNAPQDGIGVRRHGDDTALCRADVVLDAVQNALLLKGDEGRAYGRSVLLQGG